MRLFHQRKRHPQRLEGAPPSRHPRHRAVTYSRLSCPQWPDVPGLHSFKGPLIHSANWPDKVDLVGKRVGLIGVGSTATQIIPAIQKEVKHLTAFVRSKTWVIQGYVPRSGGEG